MPKPGGKVDSNQSQVDKFKAMAKEVEADSTEGLFDQMMKKLAKAPKKPK